MIDPTLAPFRRRLKAALREATSHHRAIQACSDFAHDHGAMDPAEALAFTRGVTTRDMERCSSWQSQSVMRLELMDALMGNHGIESFQSYNGTWFYSNTGDSYAGTVLLSPGERFVVSSWGDVIETPRHYAYTSRHA